MASNIPITPGTGASSVATEQIGDVQYQRIKVVGGEAGSTSVMGVNPDRSISVSVIGSPTVTVTGSLNASIVGIPPVKIGSNSSDAGTDDNANVFGHYNVSGTLNTAPINTRLTVFNGTNWDRLRGNSSVGALVTTGASSVITISQASSIVGTYAEDAAHTPGEKGIFALAVRNDTLASITSATGDYSQFTVGPSGETVTANAPLTRWVQGTADLRVSLGGSIVAIAAQGASVFTYITAVQVANMGPASVLVTLAGGLGSILGYTIAPAGGGSNLLYPNALKTGANSAFSASISGTSSVVVSAQGFTAGI